jgi:DNA-binding NarL/FixJ family response regulator
LIKQSPQFKKFPVKTNHLVTDGSCSRIGVLLVDDNEPFRRFVRSTLSIKPELQIISEVADGLEAVQRALELQPGLIVLDIGLPSLNGIEAARRIRTLSPHSKLLFLSQESSSEVVQEALCLGALGFVIKTYAANDLLAAVESVLRKQKFVSNPLKPVDGQP